MSDRVAAAPRDRMARVRVDEQTWQEFRHAIATRSVAQRLGELVARDVGERRRRQLRAGELYAHQVVDALARARELSRDLGAITVRLETLAGPREGLERGGPLTAPGRVEGR